MALILCLPLSARVVPHTGPDVDEQQLSLYGGEDPTYSGSSWGHHQRPGTCFYSHRFYSFRINVYFNRV